MPERGPAPGPPEPTGPPAEPAGGTPADPHTNTVIQLVLRLGLAGALALLVAGLVAQLLIGRHEGVEVKMFDLFAAPTLGQTLMGLGILVLALTPVARIVSVLISWLRERDRTFVLVAVAVLAVLSAAVLAGLAG